MSRPLSYTDQAIFSQFHQSLLGVSIDFSTLDPSSVPDGLLQRVRKTWQQRFQTEFRSIQIMTRFLTEVVGAGDPIEVYSGAVDLIADEVRHTALCAELCRSLGAPPILPDPVELKDPERFVKSPMAERALATAISMVAISETLSVGFIRDLHARCTQPAIKAVLDATVADEDEHEEFGWTYIAQSLSRFPRSTLKDWRHLVEITLAPHQKRAKQILANVPLSEQHLEKWPEPELVNWGLFSSERQAIVFLHTYQSTVEPRLKQLDLLG